MTRPARPVGPVRPAARFAPLDGDAVAVVRPYVLAHERRTERVRQERRRRALVLATMGIDLPEVAV